MQVLAKNLNIFARKIVLFLFSLPAGGWMQQEGHAVPEKVALQTEI
jgi:hypothetical protein